jgi:DHA1 family bicyclomycin/chloramphenicol resistance-like MFS transporter
MAAPSAPPLDPVARPTIPVTRGIELLLGLLSAFGPLSIDMYLPAMPEIATALHTDAGGVGGTLASYFVGMGAGQLLAGPLLDRFGRLRPLRAGLALYIAGSLACALAPSIAALVAGRALQGLGGALVLTVPRAVVRDLHSGAEAARMLSQLVLIMGVAPIVAPLLGGLVLTTLGWRAIFGLLAAFAVAALAVVPRLLPETAPAPVPFAAVRGHLATLLGDRHFLGYTLAVSFAGAAMFAYIGASSFVFIELHGIPAEHFGWFFGANAVAYVASSQLNRAFLRLVPPGRILALASRANAALGLVVLLVAWTGAGGPWGLGAALFAFMGTLGCVNPNATALALERHGPRAGLASAVQGATASAVAASVAWAVGAVHDGTALPMGAGVAACATVAAALAFASAAAPRTAPHAASR